jgi:hypothetical protein
MFGLSRKLWRCWISIAFLVLISVSFAETSQPPTPTPPKAEQKNQTDTKDKQPPTSTDQRGTESSPVFIKVVPTLPVEPSPSEHTQQANWYTSPEWWLVWGTLILATITASLAAYTAKLWGATKALAEEAKQTSTQQASDMRASLSIAKQAAIAAERSADVANKTLSVAQRAFVFVKGVSWALHVPSDRKDIIEQISFWVDMENVGLTPATHVESWMQHKTVPWAVTEVPMFQKPTHKDESYSVLGPRVTGGSASAIIPIATMMECWNHQTRIYLWTRIEYRDIFDPEVIHHQDQCMQVEMIRDPSTTPQVPDPPPATFRVCGPQNTTG